MEEKPLLGKGDGEELGNDDELGNEMEAGDNSGKEGEFEGWILLLISPLSTGGRYPCSRVEKSRVEPMFGCEGKMNCESAS